MTRLIMLSGKGGVGKTSVAVATALASARKGYRTLILSFDLAHSVRDSLGLHEHLVAHAGPRPTPGVDQLWFQEIDIYEELERDWGPIYRYIAGLMSHGGLDNALADELAVLPGMEDIVALIALHDHFVSGEYELIVLDCPPTGETLRFIGLASWMRAYAERRLNKERRLVNLVRPLAKMAHQAAMYLPEDDFFASMKAIVDRLVLVESKLRDPDITSARLVTIPEKMVIRETQRAQMYLNMYGLHIDLVAVNRMLPVEDPYFASLAQTQLDYRAQLEASFQGTPLVSIPLFPNEVCGLDALAQLAEHLYAGEDPSRALHQSMPIRYAEEAGGVAKRLEIELPFVEREQISFSRHGEDFVLRIGNFKRILQLPWNIHAYQQQEALFQEGKLIVRFFNN